MTGTTSTREQPQPRVVVDLSVSLDGYIAGANDGPENPLGDGGELLHDWLFDGTSASRHNEFFTPVAGSEDFVDEWFETTGALVTGRRTFDLANGWGGNHPLGVPVFVLTHDAPEPGSEESSMGTFVTDGIESALEQARAAAGSKNVSVCAANLAQQYLEAGLIDVIQLHVVPVLLGDGVRLFEDIGGEHVELERTRVIESTDVTHLRYDVVNRCRAIAHEYHGKHYNE
ncbi:dihydrofolate reductase family protein [Haladaptatus sp. NG-SE-30]